jgi:hypothetical protein
MTGFVLLGLLAVVAFYTITRYNYLVQVKHNVARYLLGV